MARPAALKTLPFQRLTEGSAIARFQREARAIGALNHPNIVQAYDFDRAGGLWFLAMEYVDGASLQQFVHRHGAVPWPQACEYIAQACAGLQHAADQGVVHRDVKPANLLLDRTGVVKILDMGLARIFGEFLERGEQPLTMRFDENVLGTADYLAPEQAEDSHAVDVRADIYSLGLTLYYLLTGKLAVQGKGVAEKLRWHRDSDPPSLAEVCPAAPRELDAVLRRMIAKLPNERYAFPSEARQALAPFCRTIRASFEMTTAVRRRKFSAS
jgi:serine/threonine protein kinase